jgi:hypothetical protein
MKEPQIIVLFIFSSLVKKCASIAVRIGATDKIILTFEAKVRVSALFSKRK